MIESYLTDTFQIIHYTTDKYGVKTRIPSGIFKCRYEDEDKLVTNNLGQEVTAHSLLICATDENITYGDKLIILTRNGVAFDMPTKEWMIHNICHISSFNMQIHEIRM